MAITAAQVKELRERSGAAMMDCKRALQATDGDIEAAIEKMRKEGQAKADKKASRVAAEGIVRVAVDGTRAAIVEVNCETDFVAKNDGLVALADDAAKAVVGGDVADVEALSSVSVDGETFDERRRNLIANVGENINIRRFATLDGGDVVAHYLHGERIGVIIGLSGGDEALARDLAMHVAASKPEFVSADDVPAEVREREKNILVAQAADSGKPPEIIEKMIVGRLNKYLGEITLLGQPFVKDPDQTVAKLLKAAGASVTGFVRFEVGEGIEKEESNFAEEVMAQARASA
ncbi:translation elongation factor Ts [Abyssibacter profundi]|uniref:Elongation factor Ts n=1 Tax=Abyssibacter profundi TaxID=2182787 RepID=A0A383XQ25_9GAMM|nr:translation elongation factor Ts [Abyssibacter profundi]MBV62879.1 elongation factor Ts [Nevskiales bacterium]PWN54729.1 elongation factor Ts [Abyssibacter profundi]